MAAAVVAQSVGISINCVFLAISIGNSLYNCIILIIGDYMACCKHVIQSTLVVNNNFTFVTNFGLCICSSIIDALGDLVGVLSHRNDHRSGLQKFTAVFAVNICIVGSISCACRSYNILSLGRKSFMTRCYDIDCLCQNNLLADLADVFNINSTVFSACRSIVLDVYINIAIRLIFVDKLIEFILQLIISNAFN